MAIGGPNCAFGWGPHDDAVSVVTIRHALEGGANSIDTALVYGLGHAEQSERSPRPNWPASSETMTACPSRQPDSTQNQPQALGLDRLPQRIVGSMNYKSEDFKTAWEQEAFAENAYEIDTAARIFNIIGQ